MSENKKVRCNNCSETFYEECADERNNDCLKTINIGTDKDPEFIKACPFCKTDEYLKDIPEVPEDKKEEIKAYVEERFNSEEGKEANDSGMFSEFIPEVRYEIMEKFFSDCKSDELEYAVGEFIDSLGYYNIYGA